MVPGVERRSVISVDVGDRGFKVTLADGEVFQSRRVFLATGIGNFAWRPEEFDGIPPALVSHCSQHSDLSRFKGRRVVVIGGGQSALESAALLHESGAEVEVVVRGNGAELGRATLPPASSGSDFVAPVLRPGCRTGWPESARIGASVVPTLASRISGPRRIPVNSSCGFGVAAPSITVSTNYLGLQSCLRYCFG
jgi:hypothetical protein